MKIFHLPDLGEGLAEAEIREWYVKEGDVVTVDQPLVSMETAKAVVDVPSPYAGKIVTLHGKANDIIPTGAPFVSFEMEGQEAEAPNEKNKKNSVVGALEESTKKWTDDQVIVGAAKSKTSGLKVMPAARVLAQQFNIDLGTVTGTGPNGLITVEDVKALTHQGTNAKSIAGMETVHGVRRAMAQVMAQAHQEVAAVTIVEDADITDLPRDVDLTAKLLKAMAEAVKVEPAVNAWFDGKKLERKLFHDEVHIGMAVDTKEGLFVPVIRNVETKSPKELRETIDQYKKSVTDRSIPPKELQGATISLSNFGMIAGRYATPLIVPPMVAILGCGRTREVAVVRDGKVTSGRILPLSLTVDHRAVTGGEAARYLGAVIKYLNE